MLKINNLNSPKMCIPLLLHETNTFPAANNNKSVVFFVYVHVKKYNSLICFEILWYVASATGSALKLLPLIVVIED